MNLFYYIFYRFAHFYRRCGTPSPDLSAHNALCSIQLITILILAMTCRKIFPQIVEWNSIVFYIVILCICPILHTIQWLKCRNMYDKLQIIKIIETINIRYLYNFLKIKITYRYRMYIYISIQILIKWRYIEYEDSIIEKKISI